MNAHESVLSPWAGRHQSALLTMSASLPPELLAQGALVLVLWFAARRFAADFLRQLSGLRQARPPTFTPTAPPVRGLSGVPELALGCADTCTPAPPWGTCRLRVPASRVVHVPEAQGGLPSGSHILRASVGRSGTCCAPWHARRWTLSRARRTAGVRPRGTPSACEMAPTTSATGSSGWRCRRCCRA